MKNHAKDLTNRKNFETDVFGRKEYIEREDLVLVHRTNYFPEGGTIRTTLSRTPKLRYTIHFSLNGPVSSHNYGNWDDRDYTIFVPLGEIGEQTIQRMCAFNPADTYFLGDFKLPKGSVVLYKSGAKHDTLKGIEVKETTAKSFEEEREQIFEKIKDMGYCPIGNGTRNWVGWGDTTGDEVINDMAEHMGLPARHIAHTEVHWTSQLEYLWHRDSMKKEIDAAKTDVYSYKTFRQHIENIMQMIDTEVKKDINFYNMAYKDEIKKRETYAINLKENTKNDNEETRKRLKKEFDGETDRIMSSYEKCLKECNRNYNMFLDVKDDIKERIVKHLEKIRSEEKCKNFAVV